MPKVVCHIKAVVDARQRSGTAPTRAEVLAATLEAGASSNPVVFHQQSHLAQLTAFEAGTFGLLATAIASSDAKFRSLGMALLSFDAFELPKEVSEEAGHAPLEGAIELVPYEVPIPPKAKEEGGTRRQDDDPDDRELPPVVDSRVAPEATETETTQQATEETTTPVVSEGGGEEGPTGETTEEPPPVPPPEEPPGPPPPMSLFTEGPDGTILEPIDFNNIVAGSYVDGTQYDALGGDDVVTLATNAMEATEAGFDPLITFNAGMGNDSVGGGDLDDLIAGGEGDDTLTGGLGNDTLSGEGGNDILVGGMDNDILDGGGDSDILNGNEGNDTLFGGDGAQDILEGGAGIDIFFGEGGTDNLRIDLADVNGGAGTISGGAGGDFVFFDPTFTGATFTSTAGSLGEFAAFDTTEVLVVSDHAMTFTIYPNVIPAVSGGTSLFIQGGASNTFNLAGADNFTFMGNVTVGGVQYRQYDTTTGSLFITPGPTVLRPLFTENADGSLLDPVSFSFDVFAGTYIEGTQYDSLGGNDVIELPINMMLAIQAGYDPNNAFNAGAGNDSVRGGTLDDIINGGPGIDSLNGGTGNDTLSGGTETDFLRGSGGDDILNGDAGNDMLFGESNNDTLNGGGDDDTLDGGIGNDILIGGPGQDTFDGGDDNDQLFIDTDDLGALIDGGPGTDDMLFLGNDFMSLTVFVTAFDGVELIALAGQNSVSTIFPADVPTISDSGSLRITGNVSNSVALDATGFSFSGSAFVGGVNYNVYTSASGDVLIQDTITQVFLV